MDTRAFLEAVWPARGVYCLATPFKPGDTDVSTYAQFVYHSIDEVVRAVEHRADKDNKFFCVHTLKEDKLWNPLKKDRKTGQLGAWEKRSHANMLEARCFFFDLDVGEPTPVTPKYPTRQEALDGLDQFLFRTSLPDPLITSSGGGYHIYWRLSDALGSLEWRRHATALRYIAAREGLKADPARTNDQASVLRIVGTSNVKPGHDPRPCVALQEGVETGTASFLGQLHDLLGTDVPPAAVDTPRHQAGGNLAQTWDGPEATLDELTELCEHVATYRKAIETGDNAPEPVWYHLGCGLLQYTDGGVDTVLSLRKPTRDEGQKLAKLDQYNTACDAMPPSCATLDSKCGGDACKRCPNASLGKNPLLIAAAIRKAKALPPPTLSMTLVASAPAIIVEPPFPYKRTAAGIVTTEIETNKETGEEAEVVRVVLPYDIFPFETCARTELERSFSQWAVTIPNEEQKVLKITSSTLSDLRVLLAELNDHGVIVIKKQIERVADMMQHWLRTLQVQVAATRQYDHLGWADPEHTEFIMPTMILKADGTQAACTVSGMVKEVARTIRTSGTLADQVKLLQFYADDKYFRHQFVVLAGLAAPAFHCTDFHGSVINAAGESGGGKSSAVFTAASLWGHPTEYTVNGTKTGGSLLGQQQRVFTLSNLPYCVDEITNCDDDKIKDFVLATTQAKEGPKLNPNGTPRPTRDVYKSTFYLCSSNKSFHNLLGQGAEVGNASSMRVFEMWFPEFTTGKVEAQQFMHKVMNCYGWIGPAALEKYMKHKDYVDGVIREVMARMDRKYDFTGPERYWSADIAVVLTYAEFAASYGLIPFDISRLRRWLLDVHLPEMRKAIASDNLAHNAMSLLSSFLGDKQGQTLITNCDVSMSNQFPVGNPTGAIVAEYDKAAQKIYVRKEAFRTWLKDHHYNALKTLQDLVNDRVISAMDIKRTIGLGTDYARGRTICFEVDKSHPWFADAKPTTQAATGNVVPLRKGSAA